MEDAARKHARRPDLADELAALAAESRSAHAVTRKLHAITRALLARISAECDQGTITQDAVCNLVAIESRYEEQRQALERNTAALDGAAGSLHFARQALAQGIRIGEQRAAARGRARHARTARPALRVLGLAVPPVAAGAWAAVKGHAKGAAVSAVTAGAMAAGTVVTLHVATQPYATVPQRVTLVPAATVPASAAAATLPSPRSRRHRKATALPPSVPVTPAPAPSPVPSLTPSASPASSPPPGTLTGPGVAYLAGGTAQVTLSAEGGAADWSVSCDPGLSISPDSGYLGDGQGVTVTVTAQDPGQHGQCWLQPGGTALRVLPS